jgi:hypothetical protein
MENLNVSQGLHWGLKNVVITKYNYSMSTKPFNQVPGSSIFTINPLFAFTPNFDEIHVTINIIGKIKETNEIFIDATALFIFGVSNLKDFADYNEEKTNISFKDKNFEKMIVPMIIGVAYSTMRGILIAKGAGTILQVDYLPIINPQQFHKDFTIGDNSNVKEVE